MPDFRPPEPLDPDRLRTRCDTSAFTFRTTAELKDGPMVVGQERAEEAIRFGIGMTQAGYNVYVVGDPGMGRRALVARFLEQEAADRPVPDDWCYVNNFDDDTRPVALRLPPGRGNALREGMGRLVDDLGAALHAAFESEEYQLRRQVVQEAAREKEEEALQDLQARAREQNIAVLRTPTGFAFAPMREGEVISAADLQGLPEETQKQMQEAVGTYQEELQHILRQLPRRLRQLRENLRKLNREVAEYAAAELVSQLRDAFEDLPQVTGFIDAAVADMMASIETAFLEGGEEDGGATKLAEVLDERTYGVNLLVDHSATEGAPIVHEDNPHYQGLVGEVEQIAQMGTLTTDFNLVKAGALHRANGGYLVVDARKLLMQSFAWEGLKRALYAKEIRIESAGKALGLMSTVSLQPEPIPLDVKVIVIGEPMLYYLLQANDPDFAELFKVTADFDDRMVRGGDSDERYAGLLAALGRRDGLLPLDREAVGVVIEHASRLAGDSERLSTNLQQVNDLLREADYWAREQKKDVVGTDEVRRALDAREHRSDRLRERIHEQILRETIQLDTDGAVTGQINGLAVLEIGGFAFGKPSRITARIRMGQGEVIDIEREVTLGGPLHSKGMLILSGFLGSRYAPTQPLSLTASIVFEQSYGGVDGDSASSAELYALLSAIADVPLRQSVAVTGSVDQRGRVQAIGGVNEKIEGFFRICEARGLTGDQGVIIPAANVTHLMLHDRVIDAVRDGRFHVYAVDHVDRGMEILTGLQSGEAGPDGLFPEGTMNRRVADRLSEFTASRIAFARRERGVDHG